MNLDLPEPREAASDKSTITDLLWAAQIQVPTIYIYRTGGSENTGAGEDLEEIERYKNSDIGKFTTTGIGKSTTTKPEPSQIQALANLQFRIWNNRAIQKSGHGKICDHRDSTNTGTATNTEPEAAHIEVSKTEYRLTSVYREASKA